MLWKCYTQYASKFGKLSSGHRTGKGHFSFQSQRKAIPNTAQTTIQFHSFHMLAKWCSKFSKRGRLQQYMNCEVPDVQAGFRKGRGTRDQIANICWIIKKSKGFLVKHLLLLYWLHQSLWLCGSQQPWKILQEVGIPDNFTCLLRNLCAGQEATVRTGHGTMVWFQIRKIVHQVCILSPSLFNICRVHYEKHWAGWSTSWNQDCREKYQ